MLTPHIIDVGSSVRVGGVEVIDSSGTSVTNLIRGADTGAGIIIGHASSGATTGSVAQFISMTTAERDNTVPANGMCLYNTTTATLEGRIGGTWLDLGVGVSGLQGVYDTGNTITMTTASGGFDVSVASGSPAISLDAAGASNFSVAGADLTLATSAGGSVTIMSDSVLILNSGSGAIVTDTTSLTAAGAFSLLTTTTSALTLDSGTTGDVNLGTGASAKTVTIGNATGATGIVYTSGTAGHLFTGDMGFFGVAAVSQQANIVSLTDSSGGAANDTIAAITNANNAGSADVVPTADAIADLAAKVNGILTILSTLGLMA